MVVVLSRLVHRKGTDLLTRVIPKVCAMHSTVDFLVRATAQSAASRNVRQHGLHDRVELLLGVPHDQVRDLLVRGHFLELLVDRVVLHRDRRAACCGLFVVSTRVGGSSKFFRSP